MDIIGSTVQTSSNAGTRNYDADIMLGQTSHLEELSCAQNEYRSNLTLFELDGSSRFSLKTEKGTSVFDPDDCLMRRRHNSVELDNTGSTCCEDYPVEVEEQQIKEGSGLEEIQNADGPIGLVPCDSAMLSDGWRKVKRIILVKRFVKRLEKLKNMDPEKWILGSELQRTMLAPRRRKVQEHVKACETVTPLAKPDSVQVEASEAVIPLVHQESDATRGHETPRKLYTKRNLEWIFTATNIILEALSAAFDQVSSPNKPKYALIGLLMSVIAVCLCMGEFAYRAREAGVVFRRWGFIWWLWSPFPDYKPFGTFSDIFGLICAVFQCIFSAVQYTYFSHHADNPVHISVLPLVFAVCVAYSRFHSSNRDPLPHIHYP